MRNELRKQPEPKKLELDHTSIATIMRTVSRHEGFQFSREHGEFIGKRATNLPEFGKHIGTVDVRSINFHFKRHDFEKWIREVIGDAILATRLGKIRKEMHGEKLRTQIIKLVKGRIDELQTQ